MNDQTLLLRQVHPTPFPEHAVIDFESLNRREMERKAKRLKLTAEARGWLHAVA